MKNVLEKISNNLKRKYYIFKPYLETATSKLVENTKAIEITIIKELGKLTTVT